MCFHEDARICVDEVLTEVFRCIPHSTLESEGPLFCREMVGGRYSPRKVKGVAREQTKYLARQFFTRWIGNSPHPEEYQPSGNLGVGKGMRSLPITLFRKGSAKLLANLDQGLAEKAIERAEVATAFRLRGVEDRTKREFFKLMKEDLDKCFEPDVQAKDHYRPTIKTHPVEITDGGRVDTFDDEFHVPMFRDYAFIFDSYPHVQSVRWNDGCALAVGYTSAKHPTTDRLIRRNCKVTFPGMKPKTFKDLGSLAGIMKDGDHQFIKVVNLAKGTVIKCWTNVRGVGDQEGLYRYLVVFDEGLGTLKSYPSEEMALQASEALLSKKKAQLPLHHHHLPFAFDPSRMTAVP